MTKSRGLREHHGMRRTKAYGVWNAMQGRCRNPNNTGYANYGARGITLCPEWERFSGFLRDMGEPPPGHSLERIDNDKGYSPDNCRWASRVEQGRNKRNNILLSIDGETMPLSAWVERYGLKYATVHQRLNNGWTPEQAVKTPLIKRRKGVPKGQKLVAWGAEHGITFHDTDPTEGL